MRFTRPMLEDWAAQDPRGLVSERKGHHERLIERAYQLECEHRQKRSAALEQYRELCARRRLQGRE